MKALLAVLAVLAAVGSGAWALGARSTERAIESWLDARAAEGWLVNVGAVDTGGYPTRYTTGFTDLELADPDTGWVWTAPDFTLDQQVWALDRITATWPAEQTLASPMERLRITSDELTADLDVAFRENLALDASAMVMRGMVIESDSGERMAVAEARSQVTRQAGQAARYDVVFTARDVTPPAALARLLDPERALPATMEQMRYVAEMAFDRPWDLSALEVSRPQITQVALEEMQASWGPMLLRAAGTLDVDAEGRASGEIAVRAENWQQMLEVSSRAGLVAEAVRDTVEAALRFVARLSGRPEDIDATLRFDRGFVFLGPIPLGEGPRFVLR